MADVPDFAALVKLTPAQRKELMALVKKADNWMNDAEYVARCLAYKPVLEKQCKEAGLNLAHVFTAPDPNKPKEPAQYVHPETKEIFTPGKGKRRPDWVKVLQKKAA